MDVTDWTSADAYAAQEGEAGDLITDEAARRMHRAFDAVTARLERARTAGRNARQRGPVDSALDAMTSATAVHRSLRGVLAANGPVPFATIFDDLCRAMSLTDDDATLRVELEVDEDVAGAMLDPLPAWKICAAVVEMVETVAARPAVVRAMFRDSHLVLAVTGLADGRGGVGAPGPMLDRLAHAIRGRAVRLGPETLGVVVPVAAVPVNDRHTKG